jgi:hypothetical protein
VQLKVLTVFFEQDLDRMSLAGYYIEMVDVRKRLLAAKGVVGEGRLCFRANWDVG